MNTAAMHSQNRADALAQRFKLELELELAAVNQCLKSSAAATP